MTCHVTQYNKRYILSTFEKIEIFALSNWRFNKLSNDTKFVKIEVILLKIQLLQSVYILLFSIYFTHYFVHYLRMNLADKMSLLLYWATYFWKSNEVIKDGLGEDPERRIIWLYNSISIWYYIMWNWRFVKRLFAFLEL